MNWYGEVNDFECESMWLPSRSVMFHDALGIQAAVAKDRIEAFLLSPEV